jgi:hypothetical protein
MFSKILWLLLLFALIIIIVIGTMVCCCDVFDVWWLTVMILRCHQTQHTNTAQQHNIAPITTIATCKSNSSYHHINMMVLMLSVCALCVFLVLATQPLVVLVLVLVRSSRMIIIS